MEFISYFLSTLPKQHSRSKDIDEEFHPLNYFSTNLSTTKASRGLGKGNSSFNEGLIWEKIHAENQEDALVCRWSGAHQEYSDVNRKHKPQYLGPYVLREHRKLRVPNLLGIHFFALHLGQISVTTNVMFDNRGTAILLAVRLVFCSAISKKWSARYKRKFQQLSNDLTSERDLQIIFI